MKKLAYLFTWVVVLQTFTVWGEIVYIPGPAFSVPDYFKTTPLDINQDGTPDILFSGAIAVSIDPDGSSDGVMLYYVSSANNAELAGDSNDQVQILPEGGTIGASTPWADAMSPLAIYNDEDSNWSGVLGTAGEGYLGVEFSAADGWHYGWVQVRLPQAGEIRFSPVVVDWAYESTPGKALVAGAKPIYFGVAMNNRGPAWDQPLGGGMLTLEVQADGYDLDYHLQFQASLKPVRATMYAAVNSRYNGSPLVVDLGEYDATNEPPIVFSSSGVWAGQKQNPAPLQLPLTVYSGQVHLNDWQAAALKEGRLDIRIELTLNTPRPQKVEVACQIIPGE